MICRGAEDCSRGEERNAFTCLQPAGVDAAKALVRTKKNLHGGILKRLVVVCFNGKKKE